MEAVVALALLQGHFKCQSDLSLVSRLTRGVQSTHAFLYFFPVIYRDRLQLDTDTAVACAPPLPPFEPETWVTLSRLVG
jgi:hypothetical protein